MKHLLGMGAAALLALVAASHSWAAGCCKDKCHCITPPPADCPDCSDPCCHKCRIGCPFGAEHTQKLKDQLCDGNCCERVKAVKKLGCCLHADICKCPDVVSAIVHALQCDTCWEVRREAALALMHQNARVPHAVVALYIASRIDRHYMVRDGALMALDVLLVCRRDCYKDIFLAADRLILRVRKDYDPTNGKCVDLLLDFCAGAGTTVAVQAVQPPAELVPAPKDPGK